MRLKGDYHHNCNVLALGKNELIVVRKQGKNTKQEAKSFLAYPNATDFSREMNFGGTPKLPTQVATCHKVDDGPARSQTSITNIAPVLNIHVCLLFYATLITVVNECNFRIDNSILQIVNNCPFIRIERMRYNFRIHSSI